MRQKWILWMAVVACLAWLPSNAEAQGPACTGMCWADSTGDIYCGFTALQEGGRC
jgi:hypothetical protein